MRWDPNGSNSGPFTKSNDLCNFAELSQKKNRKIEIQIRGDNENEESYLVQRRPTRQ